MSERERWRAMPDEEALERIRREMGRSGQEARFALGILRGEIRGDAFITPSEPGAPPERPEGAV